MGSILLACGAMAARDCVGTLLTIAEARGRAWLAGTMDAIGDLASIGVTVVGAGPVIQHGVTGHAVALIGAMLLTSLLGTTLWTTLGRRIGTKVPKRNEGV